ncbi:MAG: JAB domain-containing protein [Bdellovibrionota bacterium]
MSYIRYSSKVWMVLKDHISFQQEEVWCLALNSECRLLGKRMIARGTVNSCPIHARELFRYLITMNASQFILAHSHPSMNSTPSPQDFAITNRLVLIAAIMEIPLIDHLIMSENSYFSFTESALLKKINSFENSMGGLSSA